MCDLDSAYALKRIWIYASMHSTVQIKNIIIKQGKDILIWDGTADFKIYNS